MCTDNSRTCIIRYDNAHITLLEAFEYIYRLFKSKFVDLITINIKNIINPVETNGDISICMRILNEDYIITPIFKNLENYYNYTVKVISYNIKLGKVNIILDY